MIPRNIASITHLQMQVDRTDKTSPSNANAPAEILQNPMDQNAAKDIPKRSKSTLELKLRQRVSESDRLPDEDGTPEEFDRAIFHHRNPDPRILEYPFYREEFEKFGDGRLVAGF